MEDHIEHKDLPFVITKNQSLWRMVPKKVAFKFIPKSYHKQMKQLLRDKAASHSLEYPKDYTRDRFWRIWRSQMGHILRFDRYNKVPEN